MGCELGCDVCPIEVKRRCRMWDFDAFSGTGSNADADKLIIHTQTRHQLHTRIDAREATKRFKGPSGGCYNGGTPSAIGMSPTAYVTDQLEADYNAGNLTRKTE